MSEFSQKVRTMVREHVPSENGALDEFEAVITETDGLRDQMEALFAEPTAEGLKAIRRVASDYAESQIRDADMASEMVEYTKNQILNQAGTSMLAQANARSQSVLQLLG